MDSERDATRGREQDADLTADDLAGVSGGDDGSPFGGTQPWPTKPASDPGPTPFGGIQPWPPPTSPTDPPEGGKGA